MTFSKTVSGAVAALSLTVISAFATVPAQTSSCSYSFNSNLRLGAVSTDVQNLQKLLNMDAMTKVASTGAGSMGYETLRFGPATLAAVKKFQAANGISPVSGYVGPLTRATLNTICSSSAPVTSTTPTTTTNSGVTSNNIPVSVLVQGQANAKLGEFVVAGNGTVTGIELMRTGLSNNATLKNVYLYDGATRLTSASSVLTDGTIRFNSTSGLFPVSGSKTITVRADILNTNASGQTVGVAMKSVTMMGATSTPVVGVQGPLFSISSATLAGANLTTTAPSPAAVPSLNAGSMNQTLWSNNVNISTNRSNLHAVTFKMIGSAPQNTLANVQLYVDGVSRGTASMNGMMQYVFNMTSAPVALNTGSHLIELRGDVVAGSNRNFYMSLEEATDLLIEDATLPGVFVTPTYLTTNTVTNINGGQITISNGSLTINQDTTFNNTTTLVSGATNVKMASFKFAAYGEDVKVTSLTFTPLFTGAGASTTLVNVGLYVNGGQVASNVTATHNTAMQFSSLGTNLLVPAGGSVIVEIRGDVVNNSNLAVVNPEVVQFNIASGVAQGITSSQTASVSTGTGQQLTVASSNITFAQTAGFSTSTKAPNQSQVKLGSFTVQTGSAEGVTINQITVGQSGTIGTQLTNLTVKDGSTVVGTPIGNPTTSNSYSTNVSIPMSTTKTFDVYGDLGSSATGLTVIPAMTLTYRGNTSNLTVTGSAVTGATINVAVATIAAGGTTFVNASSPVAQLVVAGQASYGIATFNFKTSNSVAGAMVKDMIFTVPVNTIGSVTINGKTASVVGTTATVYDAGISIPADASGINVPVTVSLVCVNSAGGCAGVDNSNITLTLTSFTFNDGSAVQTSTPSVAVSATHKLVASKPTLTLTQSSTGGLSNGNILLGTVTVAADAAGDIELSALPITLANTAGITYANVRLMDSSGSSVIVGTAGINGSTPLTGSGTFSFNTAARKIQKGTSETYTIYGTVAGVAGAANTANVTFGLTSTGFLWNDVLGGVAGTGLTGANIYNFPQTTQTKSN